MSSLVVLGSAGLVSVLYEEVKVWFGWYLTFVLLQVWTSRVCLRWQSGRPAWHCATRCRQPRLVKVS